MILTTQSNKDNYDDLIVSIEANDNQLNLLLAVCDDLEFQNSIIQEYEQELKCSNLLAYNIFLSPEQPNFALVLRDFVKENPELKTVDNAMITVMGMEQFELPSNRKQLGELLRHLNLKREYFRKFTYSIIIWLTNDMINILSDGAIHFYEWRKGVFRFET